MARNRRSMYPDLSAEMEATRSFESNDSGAKLPESSGEEEEETSERLVSNRSSGGVNTTRGTNQSAGYSFFDDSRSFSEIISGWGDHFKNQLEEFRDDPGAWCKQTAEDFGEWIDEHKGIALLVFLVLGLLFLRLFVGGPSVDDRVYSNEVRFRNLSRALKGVLNEDPTLQPIEELRRSLKYAVYSLSGVEGNAAGKPPTVLLLAGAKTKILPLVRNIAVAVRAKSDVFVWEEEMNEKTSRMELERSIFAGFQSAPDRRRLLVLHAVDRLEAAAPLVLHSLADVESAPFKGITILVSVIADVSAVPPASAPSARSKCNEVVSNHLLSSWTSADLSADQVHPIISRLVGVSVCVR